MDITPPSGTASKSDGIEQRSSTDNAKRIETLRQASEAYQDGIIGKRLPPWLLKAPVVQLPEIADALAKSLDYRQQLKAVLGGIEGIDTFVAAELEKALLERFSLTADLRRLRFIEGRREPVINAQPVGSHLTQVEYDEKPALEVALRNFTADQAQTDGQPRGNHLLANQPITGKIPTAVEFAGLCREVDPGKRYQHHLDTILKPAKDAKNVERVLVSAYRYAMLVDAYKASLEGVLDASELALMVGICRDGKLLRLAGDLVEAKRLTLLGCALEQIVVLDVIDQGPLFNTTRRLLMYVPGDPVAPWSAFDTLHDLNRALGHRLRSKSYQRFFSRFVLRRDSQAFFSTVARTFDDLPVWAGRDLEPHLRAYPQPLFNSVAQSRIRQIKEDAAMIAMPVARLDREVQRAHDERLAAEGWALLTIAGLFVPSIGLVLLAVTAWELLGEAYHGIEAWRDGDTQEALDHLTQVATDLAVLAATAVGVTAARRIWARSSVVDALVPAQLEDGSTKLWRQDLVSYRSLVPSAATTPDARGIRRVGSRAWVEMEGHHYEVVEHADNQQWQLQPRDGHGPALRHNGAGAWRLWSEQPADWDNTRRMFRRLGEPLQGMNDDQVDEVLSFHGLEADHLRALHVYGRAPEPGMLDSAERSRLDRRIRQMINRLRGGERVDDLEVLQQAQRLPGAEECSDQALAELAWAQRRVLLGRLYDAAQATETPGITQLQRVFPGLHRRAAQALLSAACAEDRKRLLDSGRVPLRLAEAARDSVQAIRKARVLEALFIDTPQTADLARVTLGLLKHLPGAAQGVRWRLFEGSLKGPLLMETGEGQRAFDLVHLKGDFQLMDAQGGKVGEAGELFETIARAFTPGQQATLQVTDPFAHNLRVVLGRQALQRRNELQDLLGMQRPGAFRPPLRMDDGRLGYPLGGGNSRGHGRGERSLAAMVRDLYPSFSDDQVAEWVANVTGSGRQVATVLTSLRAELTELQNSLRAWARGVIGEVRQDRELVRDSLIECWQRATIAGHAEPQRDANFQLLFYNRRVGELPEIPAQVSFAHVSDLSLLDMQLLQIPDSFLLAFPRLRGLELAGNRLTRLPQHLLQMSDLRQLILTNNQIVLTTSQVATLASSTTLEMIDLSYNPLGRTFTLTGLTSLRWLNLRNTGITFFPHALSNHSRLLYLDMRNNRIRDIPEWFYRAPIWTRRRIRLAGNPLPEAQAQRVQAALIEPFVALDEATINEQLARAREVWGDAIEPPNRDLLVTLWDIVASHAPSERLYRVLRQLLLSADFLVNSQALAQRVLALLHAMQEAPALRDQLFEIANDEWQCQDGATWCLSNLEVNVLVWRARADNPDNTEQALLTLGRRLWRLDRVDMIAVQDILSRGGNPDESEVGLAYRLGLRTRLDLPIQVGNMSFRPVAGVTEQHLDRAEAIVAAAETQEALARSLIERDFWQRHLEQTYPDRFEQLDLPFQRRLADVLADDRLTDMTKKNWSDAINEERTAARRSLMLDMTLAALEEGPPNPVIDVR